MLLVLKMDQIAASVERTLGKAPLLMSHPGSSALSSLYPSVSSCTSHLVETSNASNRYRVNANSITLGATSTFSVSSSYLLYNPCLNLEFTVPANNHVDDGWGLAAINSIEISFASSLCQNLLLTGTAMKSLLLYYSSDPEKRSLVIKQCGEATAGAAVCKASIPLISLINRGQISNTYPQDASCYNGFLQLSVTFNTCEKFIFDNSTNAHPPNVTAWTNCYLTFCQSAILDAGFSVKTALQNSPMSVYSVPTTYATSYKYNKTIDADSGVQTQLTISSAPKGMLTGILLNINPTSELQGSANGQVISYVNGVNLSQLRLEYAGTDIYRADTAKEIDAITRYRFDGDDLSYNFNFHRARNVANANFSQMLGKVYFIPFDYHSGMVRSQNHIENVPSFDGSTLSITFTVDANAQRSYNDPATPFKVSALATAGAEEPEDYTIEVIYLLNALIEISDSGIDLQR